MVTKFKLEWLKVKSKKMTQKEQESSMQKGTKIQKMNLQTEMKMEVLNLFILMDPLLMFGNLAFPYYPVVQ